MNDLNRTKSSSKTIFLVCLMTVLLVGTGSFPISAGKPTYDGSKGSFAFSIVDDIVVTDPSRGREIPIKVYCPSAKGPFPIVIFSHGLGGSKKGKVYWSEFLAGHGYAVINLTHHGSDASLLDPKASPAENIKNLKNSLRGGESLKNRPLDVSSVIDQLGWITDQSSLLKGRLDKTRMGVAGHSFGAYTVMVSAGAFAHVAVQFFGKPVRDDRPIAFLAMSPAAPRPRFDPKEVYKELNRPTMTMSGSKDLSPVNPKTTAESRKVPFESMPSGDKYMLWMEGAHHWTFGDGRASKTPDPVHHKYIKILSLAFWDAYLKGSQQAKVFLQSSAFNNMAGNKAALSFK